MEALPTGFSNEIAASRRPLSLLLRVPFGRQHAAPFQGVEVTVKAAYIQSAFEFLKVLTNDAGQFITMDALPVVERQKDPRGGEVAHAFTAARAVL